MGTKEILFATTNTHKRERFQAYYKPLGLKVLNIKDLGVEVDVVEDGTTPEENALKKALGYYREAKIPTFAVDYGLYIEKFPQDKQPGLFVRRIYGDDRKVTDEEMLNYYISELTKVGGESSGKWISSIALVLEPDDIRTENFSGRTLFTAKRSPHLTPGEPLNSIQIDPDSGKYFTDLSRDEWLNLQKEREKGYVDFMQKHLQV